MSESDEFEPLPLPGDADWASVGVTRGPEMHAGHQSRVFRATLDGNPIVVKLSDRRLVDDSFFRRIDLLASLTGLSASVVAPVPLGSELVNRLDDWLVVAYPYLAGKTPDVTVQRDVSELASTLAELHHVLAQHATVELPTLAALRIDGGPTLGSGFGPAQLLHGDFSSANALRVNGQVRVFDFDDCGYGPVEFEVGNTLYMVLFDAWMMSNLGKYERFRAWFADSYRAESGRPVTDAALNTAIQIRVSALDCWLTDPVVAPIAIRTSTPKWRDLLRAFVNAQTLES